MSAPNSIMSSSLNSLGWCALSFAAVGRGDALRFAVAPDTHLEKTLSVAHELQIEHMGESRDGGPDVSNGMGGWMSSTQRIDFVDHYLKTDGARPLSFVRDFRDIVLDVKSTISRGGSQMLPEKSKSASQLSGKGVEFTWVESEGDFGRCFARVEGDEEVLAQLRGEYDLIALLPGREVAVGDAWDVDLRHVRDVLAPGGDLALFPTSGSLFGRLTELGVAGDAADFLSPDCSGGMTATYRGERELVLGEADEGGEVEKLRVGVIELDLQLASSVDRAPLYRSALPDVERREPARVDSVPLLWTFQGKGELLWDLAGGHFHSLSISGKESFDISVNKTLYVAGREPSPYSQHARYSGTLTWEVTAGEPTELDDGGARASGDPNDKAAKKAAKKKRRNKK